MTRLLYAVVWIGALWQLWQGITTGCFSVSKRGFFHCWAASPIFYGVDFVFILFLIVMLPFLVLSKREPTTAPTKESKQ